ncbi:MAG TPA: YetF domain-containing protein, partial [Solirubrobacteraceae bacterium]|nr:YetF domain-containing protein [Solirubrobacteraceae bacterium]
RRELSQLEPFDLILLVVVGDLVQQGVTQSDESVTGALIVIATIALLSIAVSWVSFRSRRVRAITEGEPIVLVQDGHPIERNMRRQRITLEDIQEEARQAQISSVADLRWAILEDGGRISCIPR